jgi:hypothetical protein
MADSIHFGMCARQCPRRNSRLLLATAQIKFAADHSTKDAKTTLSSRQQSLLLLSALQCFSTIHHAPKQQWESWTERNSPSQKQSQDMCHKLPRFMIELCYVRPVVAPIGQLARGNSPARGADACCCCWRNNHDRRRLRAVNFVQISHARAVTLASGRRFYSNADVVEHRNERVRPEINIIWGAGDARVLWPQRRHAAKINF